MQACWPGTEPANGARRQSGRRLDRDGPLYRLLSDLRLVFRSIARAPALTCLVVGTLGIGIGGNSAIFSLIDRVALRPLPVEEPDRLVQVSAPPLPVNGGVFSVGGGNLQGMSYPLYRALRDGLPELFAALGVHRPAQLTVAADAGPLELYGEFISSDFLRALGLRTLAGRAITPDDDAQRDGPPVVVLNHAFWTQHFGGDRAVVGRTIRLNSVPVTVVGVLAPGYTGTGAGRRPEFFLPPGMADQLVPLRLDARTIVPWDSPNLSLFFALGRLAPGVRREDAERRAQALYRRLLDEAIAGGARVTDGDREYYATHPLRLLPAGTVGSEGSPTTRNLTTPLLLLLGMAAFVLAIAAGNVANLLAARGALRAHEAAIRFVLGASPWQILRPRLVESLLLALCCGAAGLLFSIWVGGLVPTLLDVGADLFGSATLADGRVVVFTLAVSLATGMLIWVASAFGVARRSQATSLLATRIGPGGRPAALGVRRGLVVTQVALSFTLVCTSVLLARSLRNALTVDPGFDAERLLSVTLDPRAVGYEGDRLRTYTDAALERARALPGVTSVTHASAVPLGGGFSGTWVGGPRQEGTGGQGTLVDVVHVGPDYFATIGLPLVAGRPIDRSDAAGAPAVAVVNEALAGALVGRDDPIGQSIGFEGRSRELQIVGVVRDGRGRSLKAAAAPTLYVAWAQRPAGSLHLILRAARPRAVSATAVTQALQSLDPAVAVSGFAPLTAIAREALLRDRMLAALSLAFAALSAALAALGLYGVTSHSVTSRLREIGVRLALGATGTRIQLMILGEVGLLALLGSAIGLGGFLAGSRFVRSLLFDLSPDDPATLAAAALAVAVVTLFAGLLPARRAARLDPAVALREE